MLDRCKNSNLVDGILLLFVRQVLQVDPLQGVLLTVGDPFDLVHLAVGSVAQVGDHLELLQGAGERCLHHVIGVLLATPLAMVRVLSLLRLLADLCFLLLDGRMTAMLRRDVSVTDGVVLSFMGLSLVAA